MNIIKKILKKKVSYIEYERFVNPAGLDLRFHKPVGLEKY